MCARRKILNQYGEKYGKVNTDGKKSASDNVMDELRNGWTYFECFELFEYSIDSTQKIVYYIKLIKERKNAKNDNELPESKRLPTWLINCFNY